VIASESQEEAQDLFQDHQDVLRLKVTHTPHCSQPQRRDGSIFDCQVGLFWVDKNRAGPNKPAFKVEIVLEDLTGAKSRAEICREHGLRSQMVTRWKREFLERAPEVFETDHTRDETQARIAELERMVGQLTMELAAAKKASTILSSRQQNNGR